MFKIKTFDRWADGVVSDKDLCTAAAEVMQGLFEADLGGGVCKKRVAMAGGGKSGGARTLIAKQNALAIFFVTGRKKSDPGTDFSAQQEKAAKLVAKALGNADATKLKDLLADGTIKEICNEQKIDEQPGSVSAE